MSVCLAGWLSGCRSVPLCGSVYNFSNPCTLETGCSRSCCFLLFSMILSSFEMAMWLTNLFVNKSIKFIH